MKNVVIIGAGGHGKVVADIVRANGDIFVGFLDDAPKSGVIGRVSEVNKYPDAEIIIAIGNADVRKRLSNMNVKWYTAIHPTAVISPSAEIGVGTVVMPNSVINAGAIVGKHCIVNTGAIVEHDNVLGDYVHVSVGAKLGGTVKVGDSTWIGIGATVSNNISICGGCMIGAGAVVVRDINASGTYIGVPAHRR